MSELNSQKLHEIMEKIKANAPAPPETQISKGGLLEYMKSDECKARLKKALEEYRKKHPKE